MQTIKLKKGLDIPFEGTAAETLGSVRRPEVFHIVPDQFACQGRRPCEGG